MDTIKLTTPITEEQIKLLRAGQRVLISGEIYTGRDAAHKKLIEILDNGGTLPVDIAGQVIYYVGPSPAKPGQPIGSAGPTTSGRMDTYTPKLLKEGLKVMIGKGARSAEVISAMHYYGAVYLASVGGAAALIAKKVKASKVVAYPELGPEAIHLLTVEDFPAIVVNDIYGGDLYNQGRLEYAQL